MRPLSGDGHRLVGLGIAQQEDPSAWPQRGRETKMTDSKNASAKKLLASGIPPKDVANNPGVSVPTLYR